MGTSAAEIDPRIQQTRSAIIGAFNELVLSMRYDEISVAEIITRAGVGRSTFYEHFRNKDETLKVSVTHVLTDLADAAMPPADSAMKERNIRRITAMLDHLRDNQQRARALLNGPSASAVTQVLADLIAERLRSVRQPRDATRALPTSLTSMQIAEAQLGLVRAWLNDLGSCTSTMLARGTHESTRCLVASYCEAR
jgi:AcrR family transcriptional regulator